jgi:hypothetical protein
MTRPWRATACALVLVGLAGCTAISAVPPGPLALGASHNVTLRREWSDVSKILPHSKDVRILSIDGPLLNRLYIGEGLSPGEGLIGARKDHPVPTFHADMGPGDFAEFVADSVAALGYQRVETSKLRPARFGPNSGVRLHLSAKTESGLEMAGTAEVATAGGKLYLILYIAPAEHYYEANLPDVEAILASAA